MCGCSTKGHGLVVDLVVTVGLADPKGLFPTTLRCEQEQEELLTCWELTGNRGGTGADPHRPSAGSSQEGAEALGRGRRGRAVRGGGEAGRPRPLHRPGGARRRSRRPQPAPGVLACAFRGETAAAGG